MVLGFQICFSHIFVTKNQHAIFLKKFLIPLKGQNFMTSYLFLDLQVEMTCHFEYITTSFIPTGLPSYKKIGEGHFHLWLMWLGMTLFLKIRYYLPPGLFTVMPALAGQEICLEESYLPGNLVPSSCAFCSQLLDPVIS